MKKFLLIIFLFLSCTNVFASERSFAGSEYIDNTFYIKNNGTIKQYRRAQVIRDTVTNEIAYCVEPFKLMVDNSYYDEDTLYNSIYGISEEKWERIKLYAYYGYGYKGHNNIKWVNITQMSIWRELFPDYQFDWLNNLNDRHVIYPYNSELDELNNYVNTHNILPSFKKEYTSTVGEKIALSDTNGVLKHYKIISSDFETNMTENELTINTGDSEKEGTIILQRAGEKYPDTVKYFYSEESQNVLERGNIIPINLELKVSVKTGKVIVNKVDSETNKEVPQGEASLDGAIFELLDENKEFIEELTIKNNTLEFNSLPFGKYYIREKKAGNGYYLNNKEYEVVIDENNLEKEITIDNQVIKSKVKITKYFGTKEEYENSEMKKESNIVFIIYDKDGNNIFTGATNNDGIIEVMLPYGSYTLEQINTTDGYEKVEKYDFIIDENNSVSYDIVLNDFKIEVPNASIDEEIENNIIIEVPNASIGLIKSLSYLLMELMYV